MFLEREPFRENKDGEYVLTNLDHGRSGCAICKLGPVALEVKIPATQTQRNRLLHLGRRRCSAFGSRAEDPVLDGYFSE